MASFFPLISEILPMIMPSATHVTRAKDLEPTSPTVEGPVTVRAAVVDKCDRMSATVLTVRPLSETAVHHNSEQDAIMYTVAGTGSLTVNEGFESELRKHDLGAGDFAFIPAWTEHQVVNTSEEDFVCVVIHGGPRPVGATLDGWGGDETTMGK
ncbi:Cupin, RmlC-type [Metarhizium rileyi]|uniref:Cupin, RmlC-type n=1 Tax=Metarhizium rileyi (strain RCEF 4871) TaxID=1649241 RepID=A0A162K1K6_METRR|nr:Cupin, RmlC-type [Metarhizium rileyi RCEF 4871]